MKNGYLLVVRDHNTLIEKVLAESDSCVVLQETPLSTARSLPDHLRMQFVIYGVDEGQEVCLYHTRNRAPCGWGPGDPFEDLIQAGHIKFTRA
jgi:hypothetical protein